MNVLMDADSLIKLTKANLKEFICHYFQVFLPEQVKVEIVDHGKEHPDALIVKNNISNHIIKVCSHKESFAKGENALLHIYERNTQDFDFICSDDKKFINQLKRKNIPFITSGVTLVVLLKRNTLSKIDALKKLKDLSSFIGNEEYETLTYVVENWKESS